MNEWMNEWMHEWMYDWYNERMNGAWWRSDRVDAFRPESREFESRFNLHVGTLGKSFACSCM